MEFEHTLVGTPNGITTIHRSDANTAKADHHYIRRTLSSRRRRDRY